MKWHNKLIAKSLKSQSRCMKTNFLQRRRVSFSNHDNIIEYKDNRLTVSYRPLVDNWLFQYKLPDEEKGREVKIHKTDYEHLQSLYKLANPSDPSAFHPHLLLLLLRYSFSPISIIAITPSVALCVGTKWHCPHLSFPSFNRSITSSTNVSPHP